MKHLPLLAGGERRGDKMMEDLNNGHAISDLTFEGSSLLRCDDLQDFSFDASLEVDERNFGGRHRKQTAR
jgi:hypothetical protein